MAALYRLFLVEDDRTIAGALAQLAAQWGLEAVIAKDFRNIMAEFTAAAPQLVVLDISLPFYNGYHWCREIRAVSKVPILFLSSAADNLNIVTAIDLGADDFIAKPFDPGVLMAKIQALLRRSYDFAPAAPALAHRGAVLDTGAQTLTFSGAPVPLTRNEYRILACLLENKGRVVSREKLMERLWQTDDFIDDNTLTVNVNRLRKKLVAAGLEDFIETKVGEGYLIA